MERFYRYGGILASIVLIAFGIGSIVMGVTARGEVRDNLAREAIVGTPDMAGVANKKVDTGAEAKQFADGMRKHALAATQGQTYAQMPRFLDDNGKPTHDEAAAAKDPETGKPVENGARQIWVTQTALATALNTSYFAEKVAEFGIVMGIAMLLIGIGFLILSSFALRGPTAERREASAGATSHRATPSPA